MKITRSQIIKICQKLKRDFIDYAFLSRGIHNESFIIETKQGKLVLRIENNPQSKNLGKEYDFLNKIKKGLGPKVFIFDNSKSIIKKDYIVEEFLNGKHPEKITNDFIISVAKWLKKLHKIKTKNIPEFARSGNYYSLSKSFHFQGLDLYRKFCKILSQSLRKQSDLVYDKAEILVGRSEKYFLRQETFSLNHGDLYKENIFYKNGKIKLIDWEFVKYDLPEWDLVSFIYFSNLNEKQIILFLTAYGYNTRAMGQKKVNLILLLHILWMISWWVQRLSMVLNKKIDRKTRLSVKKELLKEINKDLSKAEYLVKNFY